jgi:predicted outer membrane repeat protein
MKTIKLSVVPFLFIAGAALLGGCVGAESGEELEGSVGEEALEGLAVEVEPVLEAKVAVACSELALVNAINTANADGGGTLNLAAGCTYSITTPHGGPANGLPVITTAITLEGTGTTIRRSPAALLPFRIVEVALTGALTVKAVTLRGGRSPVLANGGGILNHGALTLTGCTLISNIAGASGGGVYNNGTMTFTSSSVTDNSTGLVGRGGALYNNGGTVTVTSTPLENNSAGLQGGGIFAVDGTMTLTTSPVTANHSSLTPGGIHRSGGTMTINASPVTANTPTNCAGSPTPVPGCIG